MDEDVTLTHISPFFMENHFHSLFDTDGEEDATRIATTLPPVVVRPVPPLVR